MANSSESKLKAKTDAWFRNTRTSHRFYLLEHLALRRVPMAMTELARITARTGRVADPYSSAGLALRALRRGDALAAYNEAMDRFNRGDLKGYRRWLRYAAKAGNEDAARELTRFETRLPHRAAFDIGRGRPARAEE
jgi:hypothetical protein